MNTRLRLILNLSLCLVLLGQPSSPRAWSSICMIQGRGFSSPLQGRVVTTRGVVTADFDQGAQKGFYLQEPDCDRYPETSDGLFVYLGERVDVVQVGQRVEVQGTVQEYYGMTELQAVPGGVHRLSDGNPLPPAPELAPPFEAQAARSYYERLESMRVALSGGRVVGPTDADGRTWLVRDDLGVGRVFADDPAGSSEVICVDDSGAFEITPGARTGDLARELLGVLDYRLGDFCMELAEAPQLIQGAVPGPGSLPADGLRLAIWNLGDLFDSLDDPATEDSQLSSAEYTRRLQKRALAIHQVLGEPALLAVQEVESLAVLQALAARAEINARYGAVLVEGIDRRGIDVGLLYRVGQLAVLESQAYQGCTRLVDGLEPDGNGDVEHPANTPTCDSDGDGALDGSRLFSRPPLAVRLRIQAGEPLAGTEIWVIVVHFKSRLEDSAYRRYTEPRRIEQAGFVAGLAQSLQAAHPQTVLAVAGDLNDWPGSPALQQLSAAGLASLFSGLERSGRYTYNYQGRSQVLDDIWVYPGGQGRVWGGAGIAHINTDFPVEAMKDGASLYRSSDHDPGWVELRAVVSQLYLPVAVGGD